METDIVPAQFVNLTAVQTASYVLLMAIVQVIIVVLLPIDRINIVQPMIKNAARAEEMVMILTSMIILPMQNVLVLIPGLVKAVIIIQAVVL
jgi:hypothetical protein